MKYLLFKINFKDNNMEVNSISALPRQAVSAESWHASCTLRLQQKSKDKMKNKKIL